MIHIPQLSCSPRTHSNSYGSQFKLICSGMMEAKCVLGLVSVVWVSGSVSVFVRSCLWVGVCVWFLLFVCMCFFLCVFLWVSLCCFCFYGRVCVSSCDQVWAYFCVFVCLSVWLWPSDFGWANVMEPPDLNTGTLIFGHLFNRHLFGKGFAGFMWTRAMVRGWK